MADELGHLGYDVDHRNYSPHEFGIPHHRTRIFIIGSRVGLKHFSFDEIDKQKTALVDIHQFIEDNPPGAKKLSAKNIECLGLWQEFIDCIPPETKLPGFPIWAMEFGATYPYEGRVSAHSCDERIDSTQIMVNRILNANDKVPAISTFIRNYA